jgi:DNA-directed RNA polymerase subunit RPC12/RpoP
MALRLYECKECLKEVQVLRLDPETDDGPPLTCPHCGWMNALVVKLAPSSLHFLGDWASNDRGGGRSQ